MDDNKEFDVSKLKPETKAVLKDLLEDFFAEPKKHPTKTGPDPDLEYDIDWFEGEYNAHAEYNKEVRLKREATVKAATELIERGYNTLELKHEEWKVLDRSYLEGTNETRLRELIPLFAELGYTELMEEWGSGYYLLMKGNGDTIKGVNIDSGEEDSSRTIYSGIQLTEVLVDGKAVKEGDRLTAHDCFRGYSFYNNDEDCCHSGNTHRWEMDYPGLTLEEFVNKFLETLK